MKSLDDDNNRMRKSNFALGIKTLLLLLACSSAGLSAAAAADAREAINALGFHAMNAPAAATKSRDMNGKAVDLENERGNWVWLVFWATWCKPCQKEMPSLETLYVGYQDQGLRVIGVAVDQGDSKVVKNFAEKHQLTFPIIHDSDGKLSASYQAGAIPTVFLISPEGRLAGVVTGGINWETPEKQNRVQALLAFKKLSDEAATTAKQDRLVMPENLLPPKIQLEADSKVIPVGKPAVFNIHITWQGEANRYFIKVPRLILPKGFLVGLVSSSSTAGSGTTKLTYHFPIQARQAGEYLIGPVELSYRHRAGGGEQFTRAGARTFYFGKPRTPGWIYALLLPVLLLTVVVTVYFYRGRQREEKPTVADAARQQAVNERYQALKKLRLGGDRQAYAVGTVELAAALGNPSGDTDAVLEKIKYGGAQLTDAQLRVYEKEIESFIGANDEHE